MSRSWRTSLLGPLWLNPPFNMFGDVEKKIRKEGAYVILICPGWRSVLPGLMALSKRHYRLPPGPTFRREGRELLPQRDWPTYALLIDHCITGGVHKPVLQCGDVESNPGPGGGPSGHPTLRTFLLSQQMTDMFSVEVERRAEAGPSGSRRTRLGLIQRVTCELCG